MINRLKQHKEMMFMNIDDALYNAKIDGDWVKSFDKGILECIVEYTSIYKGKTIDDETSFDLNADNAEAELKELWDSQWNKELGAASYESVTRIYIKRAA